MHSLRTHPVSHSHVRTHSHAHAHFTRACAHRFTLNSPSLHTRSRMRTCRGEDAARSVDARWLGAVAGRGVLGLWVQYDPLESLRFPMRNKLGRRRDRDPESRDPREGTVWVSSSRSESAGSGGRARSASHPLTVYLHLGSGLPRFHPRLGFGVE